MNSNMYQRPGPTRTPQCVREAAQPDCRLPLAIAYVPRQHFGEVYPYREALCKGTLFPELDLPFECYRTGGCV